MKKKGSISKKNLEKIKEYFRKIGKDVDIKPSGTTVK